MKKKYIRMMMPGSFMSEEHIQEVADFSIPKTIPRDVFAFQFFERTEVKTEEETLIGKSSKVGPVHMIGWVVPSSEIVGKNNRILRSNIESNSPTKEGIKTHLGNWQMKDGNTVVHEPSEFEFIKPIIWKNIESASTYQP